MRLIIWARTVYYKEFSVINGNNNKSKHEKINIWIWLAYCRKVLYAYSCTTIETPIDSVSKQTRYLTKKNIKNIMDNYNYRT